MKGTYRIIVRNKRLHYELQIRRNITIIRGDSATGKTTLIQLLDQAETLGESSGVEVISDRPCGVLRGTNWQMLLSNSHNHILFLDEESRFVKSQEFAEAAKASDNYYVIITREDLPISLIPWKKSMAYTLPENTMTYGKHTMRCIRSTIAKLTLGKTLEKLMNANPRIHCYLPESFEWLILKSGLIDGNKIQKQAILRVIQGVAWG